MSLDRFCNAGLVRECGQQAVKVPHEMEQVVDKKLPKNQAHRRPWRAWAQMLVFAVIGIVLNGICIAIVLKRDQFVDPKGDPVLIMGMVGTLFLWLALVVFRSQFTS